MKKIFFQLLFAIILVYPLSSQTTLKSGPKNEIYFSYGAASAQQIATIFDGAIILPFIATDFSVDSPIGPIIAGYRRNFSDQFSMGLMGSYTAFNQEYTVLGEQFRVQNTFITTMLDGTILYNPKSTFQLYSGLSLGSSIYTQKDTSQTASKTIFAFHLNAIGLRVGKTIGAFVEIGYGFNGLVNGGFSVKF
jgi:hypothetical protein